MMAQYLEIKAQYKDALLFYRMGDFYELFFDDAVAASAALDIALTKRGKHDGNDIAMCGVPFHAAEGYLLTLIRKGFRVAVAEQLENPAEAKKRGYKAVVKRDVVRLITPGTLTEETLLDARQHNYLAAYAEVRKTGAIAWTDISTGEFHVTDCPRIRLSPELARLGPRELLIVDGLQAELSDLTDDLGISVTALSKASFDSTSGERRLCDLFKISTPDAFGEFSRAEHGAMGALIEYLDITQKGQLPLLRPPIREKTGGVMQIDPATRRNLEITQSLSGGKDGSLLHAIDRTVTAGGGRLLQGCIASPSRDLVTINARHDSVQFFVETSRLRNDLRAALQKTPDMDRAISRIGLDRAGPRDLTAIRNGLTQAEQIAKYLESADLPDDLQHTCQDLGGHHDLIALLDDALVAEPPFIVRDGGFIASGYHVELDETRKLRDEGRGVIAGLQADYAQQCEVSSLKIKHNNVLGYFIETTATHAEKMLSAPLSETFIHRQTTANAVRFTTVPLSELETKILNAGNRALEIEKQLFASLRQTILDNAAQVLSTASALSKFDLFTAFADLASGENWCRPQMEDSNAFDITGGKHPVVEQALRRQGSQSFVANDCALSKGDDGADIWLLTGPNMAGKSTFLRQNALIALLAQAGSFVPAEKAQIGIVSQLFSRVGASDDLARGRSTFMVEMVETAAILNQADDRALVILDEIGRGTATYDGLSIAWATLEHLHDVNKCRALFATHYHEMTALADKLTGVQNATVAVKEWEGDVIFLHEVRKGAADRSYGVQVARLAGLPDAVVARARVVLDALEQGEREGGKKPKALIDDLPLFAATPPVQATMRKQSAVEDKLRDIMPDDLSPKDALTLLYELKDLLPD
ncbi:DNA mismatch repair protein MutS [Parasulfitobacter algicola]|uniref:DNA mismatch repair protein MutS n=1 Tax=Parasulfitobacter algicola TaxID=2614809 RepID=A0ABX2IL45_9RHOB|nr:DNA mismatch repair protein MutS [Sulfitobacter algicola]NSX53569.1 DNA mismatch repair protein MutS [Sulfitobacter algicola]